MTILIQNLTNETKQICRFGGSKLFILPNNIITFDCTNTQEVNYWSRQSIKNLDNIGLKVIIDPTQINYLVKLRNAGKLASIISNNNTVTISNDNGVEAPVIVENNITSNTNEVNVIESVIEEAKEPETTVVNDSVDIVENVVETFIPADVVNNTNVEEVENVSEETNNVETVENIVEYTKEYLSTLSKEELQNILIDKDIPFKKNNSVNTLISLILKN